MKHLLRRTAALAAICIWTAPAVMAQANVIPGTDVSLGLLTSGTDIQVWGRTGTFPNGQSGISLSTTSCNLGSVNVPWLQAMQENHPFIAFMMARESDGRLEQVSDRSWVKHGFFALSNSQCTPCQNPSNGTFLGVGCSDTYSTGNNGSRFWLGPKDEINPWLGDWEATCSFFDTAGGANCDGARTYQGNEPNEVNHRVVVRDQDMMTAGATYYFYGYYVIRGEPGDARKNNSLSMIFVPSFSGSNLICTTAGGSNPPTGDTILARWNGATVNQVTNGNDDGYVYLGATATDLGNGTWRYNYAIHNRDSHRATGALRIPINPVSSAFNFYFHDPDTNALNDWAVDVSGGMINWTTGDNPVTWNTIHNFGFDSTAAPQAATVTLEPFFAGPGMNVLTTTIVAPLGSDPSFFCTGKTTSAGCVPFLSTSGGASVSNPTPYNVFGNDHIENEVGVYLYSVNGKGNLDFHGGKLCVKAPFVRLSNLVKETDGIPCSSCPGNCRMFKRNFNELIQSGLDPALTAGTNVTVQVRQRDPLEPTGFGDNLANGVSFVIAP